MLLVGSANSLLNDVFNRIILICASFQNNIKGKNFNFTLVPDISAEIMVTF